MTAVQTRPRAAPGGPPRPPGPPAWLRVARRVTLVGIGASLAIAALLTLMAWLALNVEWQIPDRAALAGPTELLARDGELVARFSSEVDRRAVDLDDVSDAAIAAVVASEDERFYEHQGVDPFALIRAVVVNVRTGGITQGGSTLTQQYVKNAFVGDDLTLMRKVREAVISIQVERELTKREILERYLNTVYFGEGAYGIEAAALTYFDVPASELTVRQSALLAQLLPAPSVRNPRADPAGAASRADTVVDQMLAQGSITLAEADRARAAEVEIVPPRKTTYAAPFFVAYVRRQLEQSLGRQAVLSGNLEVRTTLDVDAQKQLDAAVAEHLPPDAAGEVRAGAVAVDPRTGAILAIHGGRDFDAHQFDLATQGRRQNGSALKPFVFAAALEEGVDPDETLPSPGGITIPSGDCVDHDGAAIEVSGGPGGSMTIREGLIQSVNTVYQQLGCRIGGPRIVQTATRMGVRNRVSTNASVALGGTRFGASVLDLASAFGTFANDGLYCPAHAIIDIRGPDGRSLPVPVETTLVPGMEPRPRPLTDAELAARPDGLAALDPEPNPEVAPPHRCAAALHPDIARTTTQALEEVVTRSTGQRADIGRPQAGKTGTTNEQRDAWFVGYTPQLSLAVWVGDPDFDGDGVEPMRDVAGIDQVYGGTIPAQIWAGAATDLLEGVPETDFLQPGELPVSERDSGPRPAPARARVDPEPDQPADPPSDEPEADPAETATSSPTPDGEDEPSPPPGEDESDPPDDGGDGPCILGVGDCD